MEALSKIVVMVIGYLLMSLLMMLLWNWLIPLLFGLIKISYLQAIGIRLLAGILFKTNKSKKELEEDLR